MLVANGGIEDSYLGLNTALGATGVENSKLKVKNDEDDDYWSSKVQDNGYADAVGFHDSYDTDWNGKDKINLLRVRACLVF